MTALTSLAIAEPSLFDEVFPHESYSICSSQEAIRRSVRLRDGQLVTSAIRLSENRRSALTDLASLYDQAWLRTNLRPESPDLVRGRVRIADLFSGCGAMTLGAEEGLRSVGMLAEPALAVDVNRQALQVYATNFPSSVIVPRSVVEIVDGAVGSRISRSELELRDRVGQIDLLLGGPPCQGHSDLNNHTRRADPKNDLYFAMARFAEVFRPAAVLIENVPGALHDRGRVVQRTRDALLALGYRVDAAVVDASTIGVPQKRKRFVLAASLNRQPDLRGIFRALYRLPRSVAWAVGDLVGISPAPETETFDTSAKHSARNQERIQYLIDHPELFELPDEERPDCHRLKQHSYRSVYGKMHWEQPAPTITTGFGSTGQGRFVHPHLPRTITPHEAARLQFIPDHFKFTESRRRALQLMIGNAIPPKLAYCVCQELYG